MSLHSPGDRWFVDETSVKVNGVWQYVYRAIDQYGQVIDVLVSARPDAAAARRFFVRALRTLEVIPSEVVTDAAPVYPPVLEELLPSARPHAEQYATNQIEADLCRTFPQPRWVDLAHRFTLHGRYTCTARAPLCADCGLNELCPSRQAPPEDAWTERAERGSQRARAGVRQSRGD